MSAIAEAAEDMHMRFGKVDILVNNAAIINGRPLIDLPFNAIDKAIKINTIAYLHVSQNQGCSQTVKHFLPTMLESNSGVKTTVVCPGHIKTELFKGFHNNSIIHPSLTAEYVAQKAIHAILADRDMVAMPFMNYIVILSKAILPRRALELIADYMGHTHAMDKFIGRQPLKY
ncbi:hypothetical protein WR25_06541 [Diploscapter pachys]|uniref:Uncharacterized protein n=1 Tax=Diploscapter pachys TaxID=2018661 RepID=A0A2A2LWL0_9BILA|nr:hypothetical protein WR25_06541 [Diploscapter pachys]